MIYSPLRYPGGKAKLAPLMEILIKRTNRVGGTYIEPFAGGAAIALELLEKGIVNEIVINDYDKRIYSFWKAIFKETDRFLERIYDVPLTISEWKRQREIINSKCNRYSFELGFATFYMNRTNVSGIIKGGVIGGYAQDSKWNMDARFNRVSLIKRIYNISSKKDSIHVYNKDVSSFIKNYLKYYSDSFIYFDPPYYSKGRQLYLNFFSLEDHIRIAELVRNIKSCDWVITYDDTPEIMKIYRDYICKKIDLKYSAGRKRKASEIIIFKNETMIPLNESLLNNNIYINLR